MLGGKKCSFFQKIWRALFSWNTRFEIHLFALLPTNDLSYFNVCITQGFKMLKKFFTKNQLFR